MNVKLGATAGLILLGTAAAVALTCTSRPPQEGSKPPDSAGGGAAPSTCAVKISEPMPKLGALPAPTVVRSTLSVGVDIPTQRIAAEIDKNVPRSLGSARRKPVGSAGEVTYNVTRGGFSFALKKERLLVSTPVIVDVSICKPLGPLCPTYGHCTPKLNATVSVPLAIGKTYDLGRSAASYGITEGCSIAGMDQTGRIRGIADKQMATVRSRIDAAIPRSIKSEAETALREITKPRALEGGGCFAVLPDSITQHPPRLNNGVLSLSASATGIVELARTACEKARAHPLPPVEKSGDAAPVKSDVGAGLTTPWAELAAALDERLRGLELANGSKITAATLQGGEDAGQPTLLIGVTLTGAVCGQTWLTGRFTPKLAGAVLELQDVAPHKSFDVVDGLATAVQERGELPIPPALIAAGDALDKATRMAVPEEVPVVISSRLEPPTLSVILNRDGAMVVLRRVGSVGAGVRQD